MVLGKETSDKSDQSDLRVFFYKNGKKVKYSSLSDDEANVYLTAAERVLVLIFGGEPDDWVFDDDDDEEAHYILRDMPPHVVEGLAGKKFQLHIFTPKNKYEVGFE